MADSSINLEDLASRFGCEISGDPKVIITEVAGLDKANKNSITFLANDKYSIADIATWSWIARHKRHDIGLNNFENLSRWFVEIAERPAVNKGFKAINKDATIDFP